jgi:peptide-methionine (S)-S-oxide reductase
MFGVREKSKMIAPERALRGRRQEMAVTNRHAVLGTPIKGRLPDGFEQLIVGMGCFWGAERVFWQADGVYTTAVGYSGGYTPNPTYEEVCAGSTGHAEVVLVVFHPAQTTYEKMLALFWENHDPTQGMRQGNDAGTQYRSAIYWGTETHHQLAHASRDAYNERLRAEGHPEITTEVAKAGPFHYAEDDHQQYLHKNPWGYCGLGGTASAVRSARHARSGPHCGPGTGCLQLANVFTDEPSPPLRRPPGES